ncbi:MAG: hypothetical protein V2B19_06760 [Pseudomonadota bacterium]
MKFFPFRLLVLCVLLPTVLYGFSVQALESYLKYRYTGGIEETYIGDMTPLFSGSRRLKDVIKENIDRYLQKDVLPVWAVSVEVLVSTQNGNILYPAAFEALDPSVLPRENQAIASENFALLNEALAVSVNVAVAFDSPISLAILAGYIFISVSVLYRFYRSGIKKLLQEEDIRNIEIKRLREQEDAYNNRLQALERERKEISAELEKRETALQSEKAKAASTEAQLFGEIVSLDSKIKENINHQAHQLKEIDVLREKILNYEAELNRGERQRIKEADSIGKRFKAIYKNVLINDRAVDGFIGLPDDMRIKAEELIHRLNDEPEQVPIKRKVFGKKGRETVLEVLFSYNGRLYFRRLKNQAVEILIIGTKNSQVKDLEYIDNVPRKE